MKNTIFAMAVVCLVVAMSFGQANNATLTGTVSDATGAVLPGVTITATNNATGVVSTMITNEAGAYTIQSLLPGTYTVSGELPGFQKQTYSNVVLGNAITVRLNFTMQVASQVQSVEVTIEADTLLATSSPTIGQVLSEKKVTDLPVVGNNVLDMLTVLGGLDNFVATTGPGQSAFGREGATLAGVSAGATPVLRDGIMVQDTRWPTGINSATVMNPDLVGEVRLIVSPVDAELGRGNGAVQILTRSGTNQFRGAAVWNVQNTALNPNTWANNRNGVPANWQNNHQFTFSGGGPIIKNKTFFYALYDMNINRQRANTYATVLTPCARNGVFRYFDSWNNGAIGTATVAQGNPTTTVVNLDGTPLTPATNTNGTPYTGQLRYVSVFGPVTFPASGPNTNCSNGTITGSSWDPFRRGPDATGLIKRTTDLMPTPNDFTNANNTLTTVDGLNVASYRYVRRFRGLDNLFSVGESTGDRRQINAKIDHNFSQKHRGNVNVSYERVTSDDTVAGLPGTWSNQNFHRPKVITAGFVSTLSSSFVNEAKFGFRETGTNVIAPWDLAENQSGINAYLPQKVNGFLVLPDITGGIGVCSPITGARPPGNCLGGGTATIGQNITATATDKSPMWTYGDTFSWLKGKHSYKFGGEIRFASSTTRSSSQGAGTFFTNFKAPAVVVGGAAPGAPLAVAGTTAIANTNPAMTGIGATDSTRARNLLNFLSGSLASVNNLYWLTDPKSTTFSDYRTDSFVTNTIKQREFDLFFKDDYKIRRDLTLNLGIRYEWYGVPYSANGLAVAPVEEGGAFGISGRDFSGWMNPGARAAATTLQFVGPHSPNPGKSVYHDDWNNFGPAVGFAWQVPWLGKERTTVRGGYQITYQGGSRFNALEVPLSFPPGRTFGASFTGNSTNPYLDLSNLSAPGVIPAPLPPGVAPMTPIPIENRSQTISFIDPNYVAPYVQNLTLSITHSVRNNLTVDLRYVGTLARKQFTTVDLNSPNFPYNGLLAEFDKVRTGAESALLNQMMNGVNICATGCTAGVTYGAIGTTVNGVPQTAALQMRNSSTFNQNLANGNYANVASSLATLNYFKVGCPAAGANGNCNLPDVNTSVVRGSVLRVNGVPENFIFTNPQFSGPVPGFGGVNAPGVGYLANMGNDNYHSFQAEATLRPTHGFSGTANYTWSKNLGFPANPVAGFGPAVQITNPVDRHADYTIVNNNHPHVLRTFGNVDLPMGPGKLLFQNSSGVLARAMEGWRFGFIYTLSSGPWASITAQNMLYNNGVPDVANADLLKELLADAGVRWGAPAGLLTEGRYFDPAKWTKVTDPQCATVSPQITTGSTRCLLQAVARIVPAGTAGAVPLNDGTGNSGLIVLQNPLPGKRGNLGQNVLRTLPIWRFDTNLAKSFQITETKRLQFRVDAFNVLNHPQPVGPLNALNPSLSINPSLTTGAAIPWGQMTSKTGGRVFQGQLRFDF